MRFLSLILMFVWLLVGCGTSTPVADVGSDGGADVVGDAAGDVAVPALSLDEILTADQARAGLISAESELLSGPKAEGRLGDYKIYNSHIAIVIEGIRRASGYRYWGGSPVDVAALVEGVPLPDTYGEFFHAWNFSILWPETVEIVDDGAVSGEAHIRIRGKTGPLYFAEHFLSDLIVIEDVDFDVVYDYRLGAADHVLRQEVTITNLSGETTWVDYALSLSNAGDGAYVYTPGLGFDAGTGSELIPYFVLGDHRHAYAWISEAGDIQTFITQKGVSLLAHDAYKIGPGATRKQLMYLAASPDGPAGVERLFRQLRGLPQWESVEGQVVLPATADSSVTWVAALAGIEVSEVVPVDSDGRFELQLAPGVYTLQAYSRFHAASEPVPHTVGESTDPVSLTIPEAATVSVSVIDVSTGDSSPGRVHFDRVGGTPGAYAPQHLRPMDKFGVGNRNLSMYITSDKETAILPAGSYTVTATRGFSYEIDETTVELTAGQNEPLVLEVERVVDTTGWVSADFHIHALWSPDSYAPYDLRVKQSIAADLDLPILTEHVYASSFTNKIDELGLEDEILGMAGQEVTTFAYGHFNAFPLVWDPSKPNMGAIFPFDKSPIEIFDAIRNQSAGEVVIQVNHPRGTVNGAYFSYVGLDAANDVVEKPEAWSTNWDTIEAFNGSCSGGSALEEVQDWIGLTNNGYRKTLSSGSDVHAVDASPGVPRNWIRVTEAEVRADPENLVPVVRDRNLFVSCGPFVRFSAIGKDDLEVGLGGLVAKDDKGEVAFNAVVEAPTWIALTEVRLWENGLVIDILDISASADPVVRLEHTFTVSPEADAWYALEVIGTGNLAPIDGSPPYALTNAIEVDADGDGTWTPPGS